MLLLPEPLGPATIQKIGRSAFARATVGRTEQTLVLAPRLGNVLSEEVVEAAVEARAVGVKRPNGLSTASGGHHALLADRTGCRLRKSTRAQAPVDDLCHERSPIHLVVPYMDFSDPLTGRTLTRTAAPACPPG